MSRSVLSLASAATVAVVVMSCWPRGTAHERKRFVMHRLLAAEDRPHASRADSARYRWSVDDISSEWISQAGENSVTLGSPRLELRSLDTVESIRVTFKTTTNPIRAVLLWSAEPRLSRADFLRNRRELSPDVSGVATIRGKDLRAHSETPLRHLFVHLTGTTDPERFIESFAVVTFEDARTHAEVFRVMIDGESRDVLSLTPNELWSSPGGLDVPDAAVLRFGVRSERTTRLRLHLVADGTRRSLFDRSVEGGAKGWQDFEVTLPSATSAMFEVEVQSESPVLWANPLVLAPVPIERPNVILYVVDSLRADALGLYGGEPDTSPFLDVLAGESLVVERCYAAASWTKPSVASLLTSLYPGTHRLGMRHYSDSLPDHVRTLADYFGEAGYVTAQFTANPFSGTLSNLDRGFDQYLAPDAFTAGSDATHVSAAEINERLLPWIEAHADERFFVYVQSVDPHPPFAGEEDGLPPAGAYRSAVRANDVSIARLYRHLESLGLAEKTLFVVTADHGEAFGEHGLSGHGQSVYEEEVRIPLILHWPEGIEPSRIDSLAHHVDILPTVLDVASIPVEDGLVEGRSLTRAGAGRHQPPVFVTRFVYPGDIDIDVIDRREANAVIDWPWKLIVSEGRGLELYDLSSDPAERRDLAPDHPERVAALRTELESFLSERDAVRERLVGTESNARAPRERLPSPEVLDQLRALGYVR